VNDDLGLFEQDEEHDAAERPRRRRSRRKLVLWLVGLLVLVVAGGGGYYGVRQVMGIGSYDDYPGDGDKDVVVQVQSGDSVSDIAQHLKDNDVVASAKAVVKAGEGDNRVLGVQPGYYLMKTKMSGAAAVKRIVDDASKVGAVEIKGGYQLDDVVGPDNKPVPGILSLLATASCATIDGKKTCLTADQLRQAAETADPAALGVPDWALPDVRKAPAKHRLEGLMVPGIYSVKPGASPVDVLKGVITSSVTKLQAAGLPAKAVDTGFRPYEVLVIASLVEREVITPDMGKGARVIYNRLAAAQKLGLDSTVNYELERPNLTTNDADRDKSGPYNTYGVLGLPPTPIGSPGNDALRAAFNPEPGKWLYFVKCQKDGTSCFAEDQAQHDKNVHDAQARGIF
jgi:UPF0755 protein